VKASPQHFPSTHLTDIKGWVTQNDYTSLNHHLMSAYYEPIRRYLKGSRWFATRIAARSEPAKRAGAAAGGEEELNDIVNGFFTHLLDKRDFIDGWLNSGRRLGQYLRGALWLFVTGLMRDERRELECTEMLSEAGARDDPPEMEVDKAFVRNLVAQAMVEARAECERRGFGKHWNVLVQHICEDVRHVDLADDLGVRPDRAAVMLRTAATRFELAFRGLVAQQVRSPDHVRRALTSLLEVVQ